MNAIRRLPIVPEPTAYDYVLLWRRRWVWLLAGALVGPMLVVAVASWLPAQYDAIATARVGAGPETTQAILESRTFAGRLGLTWPERIRAIRPREFPALLEIVGTAATPERAVAIANAAVLAALDEATERRARLATTRAVHLRTALDTLLPALDRPHVSALAQALMAEALANAAPPFDPLDTATSARKQPRTSWVVLVATAGLGLALAVSAAHVQHWWQMETRRRTR